MTKKLPALILAVGLSAFTLQAAPPEAVAKNWTKHCVSCHGKDGQGKTKAGSKAKVKNLTDAKYQASFDDAKAHKAIKEGLEIDGKVAMKPLGDKLTDDEIKGLIAFVRTLKK